jgi:hypothetical protein
MQRGLQPRGFSGVMTSSMGGQRWRAVKRSKDEEYWHTVAAIGAHGVLNCEHLQGL